MLDDEAHRLCKIAPVYRHLGGRLFRGGACPRQLRPRPFAASEKCMAPRIVLRIKMAAAGIVVP